MANQNSQAQGYVRKEFGVPVKRYCQMLDLKNDPELIHQYVEAHDRYHAWPEIRKGIREVGILEMEIYLFLEKILLNKLDVFIQFKALSLTM